MCMRLAEERAGFTTSVYASILIGLLANQAYDPVLMATNVLLAVHILILEEHIVLGASVHLLLNQVISFT